MVASSSVTLASEPGGAQALVEAAESLFALAKRTHQHKGKLVGAVS